MYYFYCLWKMSLFPMSGICFFLFIFSHQFYYNLPGYGWLSIHLLRFCRSSWICKLMFSFLHPQIWEIHNHYFVLYCLIFLWDLNYAYVRVLDIMPWVFAFFLILFFNLFSVFFVLLKFYSSGFKLSNSVFHRLLSSVKPTW